MAEMKFEHARIIGEKLRLARQRQRMSLRELARKADISASMLSQIETNKANPSVRSIYAIAAALDLPVDYFFPDQAVDRLIHARIIGEKLRLARQRQRMSLRELARKADISASMLSQIETGKANPSVRSIYAIAAALDLPVDYFFPDQAVDRPPPPDEFFGAEGELTASEMRGATINGPTKLPVAASLRPGSILAQVVHASARPTILLKGGVTWTRLTASTEGDAEFLEITYACGATSGENLSHHQGREFGLILEGELVVQLSEQEFILNAGDSIVFDSTTPHLLTNRGEQPMRALWIVWHQM
jgi:transcriptional regulator with XRE-family HTH domain/mannose-6-phosphate isomerase-like protein (cupin superfamily)